MPTIDLRIDPPLSIRERVYDHLKQEIRNGRLTSGSILVESRLAEQIGVSRTPVREALHFLEKEGLLEPLPRAGYRVREIELKEFEEICEIRKVNEDLAVRWAIERISPETLSGLERNLAAAGDRLREKAWEAFVDLDAEFHELLAEASGSRRLQELIKSLRADMLRYRIQSLHRPFTAALALEGHRKVFQCIREGDVKGASEEVLAHLEESKKYILLHAFEKKERE
ncbi:MAG: GntR family transcriptional regulator [Deltaproteobacteria bacterium]|nr:GntR family transcriptional regulator [Deltaproteobacteria bacterium]